MWTRPTKQGNLVTMRAQQEAVNNWRKGDNSLKIWTVGVFAPIKIGERYSVYLRKYKPSWPGCCVHKVEAIDGTRAKIAAITQHKEKCL